MTRSVLLLLWLLTPTLAAAQALPAPRLRMELEKQVALVGQPNTLELTLLVPTWMPQPPVFPSYEAPNLLTRPPLGESRPTSERIGGETWAGVTRTYQLSPMAIGRFRLESRPLTVTFADPETREPIVAQLRTEEISFEAVIPEAAGDLDPFIAAETLTLEQGIEGDPAKLEPGDAFTLTVTARVTGAAAIFLPPMIQPLASESIAAYPKEPRLSESIERGTIVGERVESVTYVAEAPGRAALPPIRLRWYDFRNEQIEEARLRGFEIVSRGPLPGPLATFAPRAVAAWMLVLALGIAIAWLGTARFGPRIAAWRRSRRAAYLASEAFAFAQAMAALRDRELGDAIRATWLWQSRLNGSALDHPRLSEAFARLGAALYGSDRRHPPDDAWSEALEALRDARRECLEASRSAHSPRALPPLNPRAAS